MKTLEERYSLCKDCSIRRIKVNCHWRCREYWKYVGAIEQKAIDIEKAKNAFNNACGWTSAYPLYNEVLKEFMKAL